MDHQAAATAAVGLFVPCYVDQLYPRVAIATLELLEKAGYSVCYPLDQTCCGQPLANAGYERYGTRVLDHFAEQFEGVDYIVAPSGSCVMHVREHLPARVPGGEEEGRPRIFELCQFLAERAVPLPRVSFPYRVGLHASCHGLRGLRLARSTELQLPPFDRVRDLLARVEGIELVDLQRPDECCGFGGTFAVTEEAVSVKMGVDRLRDHVAAGAEVITGTDMSCLMHLEGIIRRERLPLRVVHVSEILNGSAV